MKYLENKVVSIYSIDDHNISASVLEKNTNKRYRNELYAKKNLVNFKSNVCITFCTYNKRFYEEYDNIPKYYMTVSE